MKTPDPTKAESSVPATGAQIVAVGTLPVRYATVTAEVLSRLLGYEHMTGMEAVFDASTTRLAAVVHYLEEKYSWTIERRDKVVGCKDGRVAFVSEYWIDPEVIALACAGCWREKVSTARSSLRAKAALAQTLAARANDAARRREKHHPSGQFGLFEVAAVGAQMGAGK